MRQKGFANIFVILLVLIIIIVLGYIFLAKISNISGNDVIAPFKPGETVLSESVSCIFNKPAVGDRVIFNPVQNENDFIGIITKVENQDNITTYTIASIKEGQPWKVTADKITRKVYFPLISKDEMMKIVESLLSSSSVACTMEAKICPDGSSVGRVGPNCEFSPCPTTTQTQNETSSSGQTNKAEGKDCGGFAGETGSNACPTGYYCKYPAPMYPDASGICTKK